MRSPLQLLLCVFSVCILGLSAQGAGQSDGDMRTIMSDGTAKVTRTPDFVELVFSAIHDAETPGAAHSVVQEQVEAAIGAIREMQLKDLVIASAEVDLQPRYSDYQRDVRKIIGYRASNTFRVRTSDLTCVAKVADAAIAAGCKEIVQVTYGINAAIEAREAAVALATKAAKRKATVMAEALDVKLGKVSTARTFSGFAQRRWSRWDRSSEPVTQMYLNMSESSEPASDVSNAYEPGKVEIWAQATVTFEIIQ